LLWNAVLEQSCDRDFGNFFIWTHFYCSVSRGGGTRLSIADEYRRYAAECMALAERVVDSADKSHLVIMAQAFLELAEKREKLDPQSE
jgi:hypothetical protein